MPFITRRDGGAICEIHADPQRDFYEVAPGKVRSTQEELPEDHPEVVAFRNRGQPNAQDNPPPPLADASDGDGGFVPEVGVEEAPAYAGTMLGEHTLDERKNLLSLAIDDACEDRIEARAPPGYADTLASLRNHQQGAQEHSLPPLSAEQFAELQALEALDSWINRMRSYGAATRRALRTWPLETLEAFDVALADWPTLGEPA